MTDLEAIHFDSCTKWGARNGYISKALPASCSLWGEGRGKREPNSCVEPLISPVKISSFRVKTFIKTQKDVHFTNHFIVSASFFKISHTKCYWCWKNIVLFFLNQNCSTDETWPPEATLDGTGHSPTLSGSGILLAFTDLSNFSWLRRDPRETILTHLLTEAKKSSADQGCRAWKRTLVSTPGPWPPDHSTSPSFILIKVRRGLQAHIPFIYSVHPLACLSLA